MSKGGGGGGGKSNAFEMSRGLAVLDVGQSCVCQRTKSTHKKRITCGANEKCVFAKVSSSHFINELSLSVSYKKISRLSLFHVRMT